MDAETLSLQFVPAEQVILHEGVEPRRVSELIQRLRSDGLLKNPPVVAPIGERWVVLDGATRVTALQEIGARHLLVQVVDPQRPGLEVSTWHHLVTGLKPADLRDQLSRISGVRLSEHAGEAEAQRLLEERRLLCYLVLH
ncbi:MAG: ParB N-terminal domain-containing protein, partial [Chloroflexi bacterium]|nr:ParB N-terminal domain-containing protein [Chloroflexota bacterium]